MTGCQRLKESSTASVPLSDATPVLSYELKQSELLSYGYISVPGLERFDLSGLALLANGDLLLISDRSSSLYKLRPEARQGTSFVAEPIFDIAELLNENRRFDLEALQLRPKNRLWLADEATQQVIELDLQTGAANYLLPRFFGVLLEGQGFDVHRGLEAIAALPNSVALIHEQPPIHLLEVNLEPAKIVRQLALQTRPHTTDITDAFFEQRTFSRQGTSRLYLLSRNTWRVLVVSWRKGNASRVMESWDFSWTKGDPRFAYWMRAQSNNRTKEPHHPEWGVAEAMTLDRCSVWLGFDNNGDTLQANQELRPPLLRFRRPDAPKSTTCP